MHKGSKFVSKTQFLKKCNILEDISGRPLLNAIATIIGIIVTLLLFCLLYTCCQYKRVSNKYEAIKQIHPSPNSQIVDRNARP